MLARTLTTTLAGYLAFILLGVLLGRVARPTIMQPGAAAQAALLDEGLLVGLKSGSKFLY